MRDSFVVLTAHLPRRQSTAFYDAYKRLFDVLVEELAQTLPGFSPMLVILPDDEDIGEVDVYVRSTADIATNDALTTLRTIIDAWSQSIAFVRDDFDVYRIVHALSATFGKTGFDDEPW